MQCPANGWNWFVYSDLHPYNPVDGGGLTGLSVNASAPNTYVVPNDFKVLSVYNHEIKVEENTSVPEAENSAEDGANWAAEAVFNCVYDDDEQTLKANVTTEVFEPTFTEDGRIVHTARVMFNGQEYSDVKVVKTDDKLVLTYEKVEATAATYTSDGNTEYYIGADGKYYVKDGNTYIETTLAAVTIARLPLVHHNAVASSCTKNGNVEYWHDEVNGRYFSDANGEQEITLAQTVVNALGHSFGEWAVTKEAQVGVRGEETHICSRCGETETREIAALPYVPVTNEDGDKVYVEIVTEEPKDVTELFAQAKAEDGNVKVQTDSFAIVFDNNAVSAIGDASVTLSAQVITENLPENVPENTELVLEVTLTGATFEGGQAQVTIPFEKEVPTGKVVKVYYVDDLGNKTDMNAIFENGKVTFLTNHFSTYVLVFEEEEVADDTLRFYGASLTLQNNLRINFLVTKALIDENGYENLYVRFGMNGNEIVVSDYTVDGDYYKFSFSNIAPDKMNDTITATLYATRGGVEYSDELEYSIAQYCYSMLSKEGTSDALRTLLVDLLRYGAASQIYTGHHTDALVDAALTAEQLAWGTAADPDMTSVANADYHEVEDPSVVWNGVSLNLRDSITMQFIFTVSSVEGITIKVENGNGDILKEISADELAISGGYYIAKFNGLTAGQMSDTVYVTAYLGDTAISNTVAYSIESYAYAKQNDSNENLANLVKAMMNYGNAAVAYAY